MGKIEIYGVVQSPPTRAVIFVLKAIGVPYELKNIINDVTRDEWKELNPQLTIPVMVDDGFVLSESRSIMQYLVDKYAEDDPLYPKDLKARALIDARLGFDCGNWWPKVYPPIRNLIFFNKKITEETVASMLEPLTVVEEFLSRNKWVAGPTMTIADISYFVIATACLAFKLDLKPYPKILKWIEECKQNIRGYQLNEEGNQILRAQFEEAQKRISPTEVKKIELYGVIQSPPTRAVLLVLEELSVPYELIVPTDFKNKEFKKLNPQSTIPVIVDDGFALSESRAIIQYLTDKYAKDDSLYPKDLKSRAMVNARLNFDCSSWWPKFYAPMKERYLHNKEITEESIKSMCEPLPVVEEFLTRNKWVAGPKITIADISFFAIATTYPASNLDLKPYPKILKWIEECKKNLRGIKLNDEGIEVWSQGFTGKK